jgi:hypothetical protein
MPSGASPSVAVIGCGLLPAKTAHLSVGGGEAGQIPPCLSPQEIMGFWEGNYFQKQNPLQPVLC